MELVKIFAILLLVPLLVSAKEFNYTSFDDSVSVGAKYNVQMYTNETINFTISCLIAFKDAYNNTLKSITSDNDYNLIRINRDGWVNSYTVIDDGFIVGQNYTLFASCGDYTHWKTFMVDVPGDIWLNKFVANQMSFYVTYPTESWKFIVFGGIAFMFLMYAIHEARRYR